MVDLTHGLLLPLCQQGKNANFIQKLVPEDNNWCNVSNWNKTGTAGRDTYPGETSGQQINGNELSRVTNFYLYNKF